MRRIRYSVAMSLDGYIAGPAGEADWIAMDPGIDFSAFVARFDTILLGRKSFELMAESGGDGPVFGMDTYVASRTLRPEDCPAVTVLGENAEERIAKLRSGDGKDIWLFGGGLLFRSLLEAGLVDAVEVGIIPILLGSGIPLLPPIETRVPLELTGHRHYASTGTVFLEYSVGLSDDDG
ncbi:MAG: dihydrofolate reductase family protein [Gemmatimonadota bacterium]